jgi:ATP-dependent Clp protease ATP-binding subunit ClpA
MFERFDEPARRALFFARHAVTRVGGKTIEPEHLVLGVLHDAGEIARVLGGPAAVGSLRTRLETACRGSEKPPASAELPFADDARMAIEGAATEADELKNHWIRPEHIVLGVLVKTNGTAARTLRDAGVDVDVLRAYLRSVVDDPADEPAAQSWSMEGVVVRQWKGVVKPGLADDYIRHLRDETLPALKKLPGFVHATIMRREIDEGTEFRVDTIWRSLREIEAFAGSDVTKAVVPPDAQKLLLRYDDRAVHYEIVQ